MARLRGKHSFYLVNGITANGQTPLQDCEWSPSRYSKSKPLLIHNVLRYVKLLTEQVRKGNLSKDAVNRKKETVFENGRLIGYLK